MLPTCIGRYDRARRSEWARNGRNDAWLDHRAERLRAAERVSTRPDFRKRLGYDGLAYIDACRRRETAERRKKVLAYTLVGCLSLVVLGGLAALKYQRQLQDQLYWLRHVHTLTAEQEHALKPLGWFSESAIARKWSSYRPETSLWARLCDPTSSHRTRLRFPMASRSAVLK